MEYSVTVDLEETAYDVTQYELLKCIDATIKVLDGILADNLIQRAKFDKIIGSTVGIKDVPSITRAWVSTSRNRGLHIGEEKLVNANWNQWRYTIGADHVAIADEKVAWTEKRVGEIKAKLGITRARVVKGLKLLSSDMIYLPHRADTEYLKFKSCANYSFRVVRRAKSVICKSCHAMVNISELDSHKRTHVVCKTRASNRKHANDGDVQVGMNTIVGKLILEGKLNIGEAVPIDWQIWIPKFLDEAITMYKEGKFKGMSLEEYLTKMVGAKSGDDTK